jgi:3-keto-L-gulonate-6-phosphate decarboxylase
MEQYSAAITEYSHATTMINTRVTVTCRGDDNQIEKAIDTAREFSDKIYGELIAHIVAHGC